MDLIIIPITNQEPFNIFFSMIFWPGLALLPVIMAFKVLARS
jgi:hypothetical protein